MEQRRRRIRLGAHDEASTAFETAYDTLGIQVSEQPCGNPPGG